MKIRLSSIDAIKRFVRICNDFPNDVDLISGRYIVDGKSIMGIFSLDLSNEIECVFRPEADAELLSQISEFICSD